MSRGDTFAASLPLTAGVFDVCVITGLAGGRWSGESVRTRGRGDA